MILLAIAVLVIAAVCILACWIGDDTITVDPEPREIIPAAEQCAVADCETPWKTQRTGWALCHKHDAELYTGRGGAA